MDPTTPDNRARPGLRPVIDASGPTIPLGALIVVLEAVAAVRPVLAGFAELADLYRAASRTISELTGAEWPHP